MMVMMRMVGLRRKLILAFGGLLALLFCVGGLSIVLLGRYSATLETIFRENYDTVLYARHMQEAVDEIDSLAEESVWNTPAVEPLPTARTADAFARFENNLAAERGNITLAGEAEAVDRLERSWRAYRADLERMFGGHGDAAERRELYRTELLPGAQAVKAVAQRIIDLNIANMLSIDGQVRSQAVTARNAMAALILVGALLAVLFTLLISRSILRPLQTLTASVRSIEEGNLDQAVEVTSGDEVGELAQAFNAMAARLREFRRSDQAVLVRTQRTTQLALNSFPDAVAVLGTDGNVELANETARRVFGFEPGSNISGTSMPALREIFEKTVQTRQAFRPGNYESAIRVFDSGERHFQPQAVPILADDAVDEKAGHAAARHISDDPRLVGVTIVLTDVTSLRQLDQTKSGLISVVSHELKTPLTSIRMATHLLLDGSAGPLNERQASLLAAACEDSDRLSSIIDGLLDIGRMESGSELMELAVVPVEEFVEHAIQPVLSRFAARGVRLEQKLEKAMPPVLADVQRAGHVFVNLLDNALRFSPAGAVVRLTAERDGAFAKFSIEDSGPGIDAADLPRIFDRFYRAPQQPPHSGVGLGLAIVKEIVEAHGGAVSVESNPAGGSTFRFTLRLADAGEANAPRTVRPPAIGS